MPRLELNLAEKIVVARRRLGETQEVFARRFGVKALTINKWEDGSNSPRDKYLELLQQLFRQTQMDEEPRNIETLQFDLPFEQPINVALGMKPPGTADALHVEVRFERKTGS